MWHLWSRTRLPVQERYERQVWCLSWEDPLEKGVATHSSILARRVPGRGVWRAQSGTQLKWFSMHTCTCWASPMAQLVKNPPAMQETWVQTLGWEDPLEKQKATHSYILTWTVPWIIYNPWGRKESDMTERLSLTCTCYHIPIMMEYTFWSKTETFRVDK